MNVMNAVPIFIFLTVLITCKHMTGQSHENTYSQDTWHNAFDQSVKENKNVIIVFYASWCKPSIWMDKFVFSQEEIKNTLRSQYITLRVNIDEIEGFELKNKMEIKILPTFLIMSPDQRVLERVENVLDKNQMLLLIQKYRETNVLYHSSAKRVNQSPLWKKGLDYNEERLIAHSQTSIPVIAETPKKENHTHSLVLGVYTEYSETSAYLESIRNTIHWPLSVSHFFENDKVQFTVKLGAFEVEEEAIWVRDELENKFGIKSYIF